MISGSSRDYASPDGQRASGPSTKLVSKGKVIEPERGSHLVPPVPASTSLTTPIPPSPDLPKLHFALTFLVERGGELLRWKESWGEAEEAVDWLGTGRGT